MLSGVPTPMSEAAVKASALKRHEHARKCKKSFDECKTCRENMQWFSDLPLHWLNMVLREK
jgi:hypothetical protein